MSNLNDSLEAVAARHDPDGKLQKILDAVTGMQTSFGALGLVVEGFGKDIAALKLAVQSIQQFLGAPDATISPEDQAALDAKLAADTAEAKQLSDLATEVGSISTHPPQ